MYTRVLVCLSASTNAHTYLENVCARSVAQFQYTYRHQCSLYEKCVVLILKLCEISKNIKAPASLQSLTRDIFPELILSRIVYTQNVRNTVHKRHCYPEVHQSLF